MQQTTKYKLNLIERDDPFLPEGLNENTRKLEQVVSQHLEGMDQRVAVLEAHKVVMGTYQGTYKTDGTGIDEQHIHIGFCPHFVVAWYQSGIYPALFTGAGQTASCMRSAGDGVYVMSAANSIGQTYSFFAFR